jgi:hypothetical protein
VLELLCGLDAAKEAERRCSKSSLKASIKFSISVNIVLLTIYTQNDIFKKKTLM